MAEVDLATGRLGEGCAGLGPDHRRLTTFGPTGASIPQLQLPDWDEVLRQVALASAVFPAIAMQAWDIALTTRRPVPVEMNPCGGVRVMQALVQRGLLSTELKELIDATG